jgi:hypothetical protein
VPALIAVATAALTVVSFVFDTVTNLEIAVAVFYVAVGNKELARAGALASSP